MQGCAMNFKAHILILVGILVAATHGLGIGGATLAFPEKPLITRSRWVQPGGGLMYFRDPSPSHLRYPTNSYKTRTEDQDDETRWHWISRKAQEYDEENARRPTFESAEVLPTTSRVMERSSDDNSNPSFEAAESEAEKILKNIMRRINMLRSRKREIFKPSQPMELTASSFVGPKPPLLIMG